MGTHLEAGAYADDVGARFGEADGHGLRVEVSAGMHGAKAFVRVHK